jgi:hypothetical protein
MELLIKSVGDIDYQPEKCKYLFSNLSKLCSYNLKRIVFITDVKELSQRCMGPEELLQQKINVQSLGEQINTLLKKNVFYNYTQFIDTAKEIASNL